MNLAPIPLANRNGAGPGGGDAGADLRALTQDEPDVLIRRELFMAAGAGAGARDHVARLVRARGGGDGGGGGGGDMERCADARKTDTARRPEAAVRIVGSA